jgi:hypothetical protein
MQYWDEQTPKLEDTSPKRKVAVLLNQQVENNRTIPNNKRT